LAKREILPNHQYRESHSFPKAKFQPRLLYELARQHGVQTSYYDVQGRRHGATPEALLAVLQALGAPVARPEDAAGALRAVRQARWRRCCEPVTVAWDGGPAALELRLPAGQDRGQVHCRLELEDGEVRQWACDLTGLRVLRRATVEGVEYVARELPTPSGLPPGYHRLKLAMPGYEGETLVVAAPRRAFGLAADGGRVWGVFVPLYALRSARNWGAGDTGDLERMWDWVRELGGGLVGTLPLLAAFLDQPFDPSPYAPVSRLFWNEFYLDVTRIPELERCAPARQLVSSRAFGKECDVLRRASLVDYRRAMALKRRVLELLAREFFAADSDRQAAFRRWVADCPGVRDYARFRAAVEHQRGGWTSWPARMRAGRLEEGDYDPQAERYHLYVQWVAREQFGALAERARAQGVGLYLDFPLGVHREGYDVWREREVFVLEANAGAPPDPFFTGGQDWGFPPLHPEAVRVQGYRYYLACLQHHLRHAGTLRLDHVMGLHRLFWVPRGLPAREGVYVRYPAEEFYALLCLESHRHRAVLVGEDLGTVPRYVRAAMARHGVYRMYILPFELTPHPKKPLRSVPADSLAGLNTHDMPPFAAFWSGSEDALRASLAGFLRNRGWLAVPNEGTAEVLRACLKYLAASRARVVLVNLEDLWLETEPQNVPGTGAERPNWRRKARYALEELDRLPGIRETLREVDLLRRKG
jgi:4-alpha-glucanotransferase